MVSPLLFWFSMLILMGIGVRANYPLNTIVPAQNVIVQTNQTVPVNCPARLFVPQNYSFPRPAIVFCHGSGGLYRNNDPSDVIEENFRRWADMAVARGYIALFVDSYTPRGGKSNADAVTIRPYDVYAGVKFLRTASILSGKVRPNEIHLIGWSHGGIAVLAAMSKTDTHRIAWPIRSSIAFYPGCGMNNAFGGISSSTYCPYSEVLILHGSLDSLYTDGYCGKRIQRATTVLQCASVALGNPFQMNVYSGAKHSFDEAEQEDVPTRFTQADVNARIAADNAALAWMVASLSRAESTSADSVSAPSNHTVYLVIGVILAVVVVVFSAVIVGVIIVRAQKNKDLFGGHPNRKKEAREALETKLLDATVARQ